jgi:hypothetical protein
MIPFANGFPSTPIYDVPMKKFEKLMHQELFPVRKIAAFSADKIILS